MEQLPRRREQKVKYQQIVDILTAIGKRLDAQYTVIDAEDDYRSDPVRALRLAEKELGLG